jgi:hypothetical protein
MPGLGERASRLKRFSDDLRPRPERDPYYLHTPAGEDERAPGWYMQRGGTVYLGASAGDAEQYLRDQLRDQAKKPGRRKATAR